MSNSDENELTELSEIFDVLKGDAKLFILDLQGGVKMWREAAGANVAVAGFVIVLALTSLTSGPGGLEGTLIRLAELLMAVVSIYYAVVGFRKYFKPQGRYAGLFRRAKKLE